MDERRDPETDLHTGGSQPDDDTDESQPEDIMDEYIEEFNRLYGEDKAQETLEALLDIVATVESPHVHKKDIADHCDHVTLNNLSSQEILEKFQGLGLIVLITKVNRAKNGEEYIIPVETSLFPIFESSGWGLRRVDFENHDEARKLAEQFAERLKQASEDIPITTDKVPTTYETLLRHRLTEKTASDTLDNLSDITVNVDITIGSESINSNTTRYTFEIDGEATGIVTPRPKELEKFLKQEMVELTKAATDEVIVRCPCDSLEEHLQKIEPSGTGCTTSNEAHTAEFVSEDTVQFNTTLQTLEAP
jgi:hypothetical protein